MPTLEISQAKLDLVKKVEEYYNALCTNLQLSGDDLKVFSITSVKPGEGKSTTSTSIAWAFARAGYKTLLIDGDIRNSVMSGVFKARDKITGLTEFLSGTTDLSQGLCDTNIENLFVIQAGTVSPNPTNRREIQKAKEQLEQTGKPFLGVVLNKFDTSVYKHSPYGNYGDYGKK